MPIWLRNFTYNQLVKYHKQNSAEEDQDSIVEKSIETIRNANSINRPPVIPKNVSTPRVNPNVYNVKSNKK